MKKLISIVLLTCIVLLSVFANGAKESDNEITVISREEGSGTRGAFIELVGVEQKTDGVKTDMTTENAEIANSTSVVITTVSGNRNAVGYISLGSLSEQVKAVTVDVHIRHLREKLGSEGRIIETVKGLGYRISKQ